jgi:hypothetical protein
MKGITETGLYILANILVELREMISEGPEEAKKASDEIGRILISRFDIIGGGDPDEHISQLVDGLLKGEEATTTEP